MIIAIIILSFVSLSQALVLGRVINIQKLHTKSLNKMINNIKTIEDHICEECEEGCDFNNYFGSSAH